MATAKVLGLRTAQELPVPNMHAHAQGCMTLLCPGSPRAPPQCLHTTLAADAGAHDQSAHPGAGGDGT